MSVRTTQIVAVIAVIIGAAGVGLGISAKSGNQSDEEIADSVKSELSDELGSSQRKQSAAEAALDRRLTALEQQVKGLSGKTSSLGKRLSALQARVNKVSNDLTADVTRLDSRISELSTRVDKLDKSSSGP